METLSSLPDDLQILIIASPVIVGIILIGLALQFGFKKISSVAWFWLVVTIVLTILYINGLIEGSLSERHQVRGIFIIVSAFQTYRVLRR